MWAIDNFSFCKESAGTALKSPVYKLTLPEGEIELVIMVYPNGESYSYNRFVSAYVKVLTQDASINAKATIGIFDRHGHEKVLFKSEKSAVLNQNSMLGKPEFVERSKLVDQNSEFFIADDRLKLFCDFAVVLDCVNVRCANFKSSVIPKTLSEDIKEMFESEKFSDFTLVVNGKNLKVHKTILAARSPMFAAQMPGSNVDKMEITDLSYEAVLEFLRYIYTDQVENIDNISKDLLLASIRSKMEGLKPICYENIISKMDVANGADCLKFAHENKLQELRVASLDFFKKHAKAIIKTDGFENLKRVHPQLVFGELFELLAL